MWKTLHLPIRPRLDQLRDQLKKRLPQCPSGLERPRLLVEAVRGCVARLSPREQWFVGVASVTFGCALSYMLVIEPVWVARTRWQARIAAKERELSEVLSLQQTYQALSQDTRPAPPSGVGQFSSFAFLENLTTQIVGRQNVRAINPTTQETQAGIQRETIEVQLQGVSLRQLVELLHKIQTASITLQTTRLAIKKHYKDPYSFDVFLTTVALSAN